MPTIRSQIITAVRAALDAAGKPDGLVVVSRTAPAAEMDVLPRIRVSRMREDVQPVQPNNVRSSLVYRELRVQLEVLAGGAEPEDDLEDLLGWATQVMLQDPSWNGLAIGTQEMSTEWDTEQGDEPVGRASAEYTIRYSTKTADQGITP